MPAVARVAGRCGFGYHAAMRRFLVEPFEDVMDALEQLLLKGRLVPGMLMSIAALVVTWFCYVPIHELLHVAGCLMTGGTVSRLELAPQYGGEVFARIFPFVVSGGEYAGRLSGFDDGGSDFVYLSTDFLPFVLTILIGVPLMKACTRRRRPLLFGAAIVVGLAPFYNLPGDYYEMGSIIVTRLARISGMIPAELATALRSDDIFKLVGELFEKPESFGLNAASSRVAAGIVVTCAMILGVLLAFATYYAGSLLSNLVRRPSPVNPAPVSGA